jgi:energy-coupling factor transport system permease protein
LIGKDESSGGQLAPSSFAPPFLMPGRDLPVDSLLRRLDARVKLLLLPLLVIAVFAAPSLPRLTVLLCTALLLVALSRAGSASFWRPVYMLRWFFLCTILLHLFFTPGRTLWGFGWLSMDGLLAGLLICLQLALAVTFSSLLTTTTPPEELVSGGVSLLSPLRRFGLPVERGGALLLLVLRFIPMLGEEAARLLADKKERALSLSDRLKALLIFLEALLLRLVERAEAMAQAQVACQLPEPLPPSDGSGPLRHADRLTLLGGAAFVISLWIGLP